MQKRKNNQLELNFKENPKIKEPLKKRRKYPLEILKARLAKWKFIRTRRLKLEEETANYKSHVNYLHKKIGKPTAKNYRPYIKKVRELANEEERVARGFSSSNDKEMTQTHKEIARNYEKYAKELESARKS